MFRLSWIGIYGFSRGSDPACSVAWWLLRCRHHKWALRAAIRHISAFFFCVIVLVQLPRGVLLILLRRLLAHHMSGLALACALVYLPDAVCLLVRLCVLACWALRGCLSSLRACFKLSSCAHLRVRLCALACHALRARLLVCVVARQLAAPLACLLAL